jgi:hypothetical protein
VLSVARKYTPASQGQHFDADRTARRMESMGQLSVSEPPLRDGWSV